MPRNGSHKIKSPQSESTSDSDSSSESTESVKMYTFQEKHYHKKDKKEHHEHKKEHHEHKKDHEHKKEHDHHKKDKDCKKESESSSDDEKCRNKKDRHYKKESESSEDSDCSNKEKYTFEDIYKYFKYRLVEDCSLQVAGSDAYINAYGDNVQNIITSYPVNFNNNELEYNIDHPRFDAPFTVRKSGIYLLFFIIVVQQPAQFTLFINGVPNTISTTGNNAGAGQTIFRQMYSFNKDDTIIIRNYESTVNALISPLNIGGLLNGINTTFLLMKIAPLPSLENKLLCESWNNDCLSRRKHYLFKKITEKMLCDKELMLKGFNTHGTFYTTIQQSVATENDFIYDSSSNVLNLSWSQTDPSKVTIKEDGVYKVFFVTDTTVSIQLAFSVNGIPVDSTIFGSNKGAGQTSIRTLLVLKKGDYLTVKNHTSANGFVNTYEHAGGYLQSINAILTVIKIAPLCKPSLDECKVNNYYKKCYNKFKCFLLSNKCLQISGSDSYCNYASTHSQILQPNDQLSWEITTLKENLIHSQATSQTVISKDGIYDLFVDCITSEPSQFTLFINGTPDLTTTFGRDSGANKCILRQFIKLYKGDVIDVRNWTSISVNITTSVNAGGKLPGIPIFFMLFKLANIEDDDYKTCHKKSSKKSSKTQ
jgi:hypothetical protein